VVQPLLMPIRFGEFEIDEERFALQRRGQCLAVRPKVFDLLNLLVRFRERVVLREELVLALWGTTAVGPGSLSGLVNELRQVLDEADTETSVIRTVHARGYQFIAAVDWLGGNDSVQPDPSIEEAKRPAFDGAIESIRASFGRAANSGARAALVKGALGSDRVALFESVVEALRGVGFEIHRSSQSPGTRNPPALLVDRLVEGLVREYGVAALRSMIPVRFHEVFERDSSAHLIRGHWLSEPLAARQYEGRIHRGVAELLRTLARHRPIALVLDFDDSSAEDMASVLPAILGLLPNSPVFILASIDSTGRKSAWCQVAASALSAASPSLLTNEIAEDLGIDWIEIAGNDVHEEPVMDHARLNGFLAARGVARLPRSLADALVAHTRGDEELLESIAGALRDQAASDSSHKEESALPVGPSRMRRVEPSRLVRGPSFGTS